MHIWQIHDLWQNLTKSFFKKMKQDDKLFCYVKAESFDPDYCFKH